MFFWISHIVLLTFVIGTPLAAVEKSLQNLSYAIYPRDSDYNSARFNYNKRFSVCPEAIFCPTNVREARYVLGKLIKHKLSFSIRSGGHCFEPGSLSPDYIFDLSSFNEIIPDTQTSTVYIGAGARLQDVIATLGAIDYAIPTGGCPTVALGGLALGGGSGQLNRMFGLTCDSIQSIQLLNAKNQLITVDANNHSDLFWALRGAGNGSFGIVLGYTMKMHYVPATTFLSLAWPWDRELAREVIKRWQDWMQVAPNSITMVLAIDNPIEPTVAFGSVEPITIYVYGQKIGSEPFTEWEPIFASLNPQVFSNSGSYLENSEYWVAQPSLPYNKVKSRILKKPLKDTTLDYIIDYIDDVGKHPRPYLSFMSFESFGGAVATNEPTAFYPRDAFGWWEQTVFWDDKKYTKEILEQSRAFYEGIPDEVSKYCYANIVDYDLKKSYLKRYYGDNVPRLIKIKRKYDPKNIFHWKQSIPIQ